MLRVARCGILLFEPCDSLLTRVGVRLGVGQDYEHAAVYLNECGHGGTRDSGVPNYVYRWTEREIVKTVSSYSPHAPSRYRFFYHLNIPWRRLRERRRRLALYSLIVVLPLLRMIGKVFRRQNNLLAALVLKPVLPADLHPWLRQTDSGIQLDSRWLRRHYR
jgi:hypothetical protein